MRSSGTGLLALAVVLGASVAMFGPAYAQEQGGAAPAADDPASVTEEGAAVAEFTADMVDPADPFGELDVTEAGATAEEAVTFFEGLTPEEQGELRGRCGVVLSPVHQERYGEELASVLCRNLFGAGLIAQEDIDAVGELPEGAAPQ